jgi:hypothetical protein
MRMRIRGAVAAGVAALTAAAGVAALTAAAGVATAAAARRAAAATAGCSVAYSVPPWPRPSGPRAFRRAPRAVSRSPSRPTPRRRGGWPCSS